jgi:hypothetical protein
MEWSKVLLPLLQQIFSMYFGRQMLQRSSAHAKAVALRSSILAFGFVCFLVFFLAAIIMTFVDLGQQFEAHAGLHFSGMMLSAAYLLSLGVFLLGLCVGIAKYLAARELQRKAQAEESQNPFFILRNFGEEVLRQVITNLNQEASTRKK